LAKATLLLLLLPKHHAEVGSPAMLKLYGYTHVIVKQLNGLHKPECCSTVLLFHNQIFNQSRLDGVLVHPALKYKSKMPD
jgi:hypothetical protein